MKSVHRMSLGAACESTKGYLQKTVSDYKQFGQEWTSQREKELLSIDGKKCKVRLSPALCLFGVAQIVRGSLYVKTETGALIGPVDRVQLV